ncbi:MAG: putative toxin-antitoxin system toxin component, PIN family [Candidatus Altiarchaeota archaeon]
MNVRVVLDTNVFVSGMFWSRGNPNRVLRKCLNREVTLLISQDILDELRGILIRERKFDLSEEDIEVHLELVSMNSELVQPEQKLDIVKDDPSDNKFLECAVAGKADYIVSGDRHLEKSEYPLT